MPVHTQRALFVAVFLIVSLGFAGVAYAQRNPTMPSQLSDADKENLYSRFLDNKKVLTAERQRLAYEDAKEYLKRFGGDKDANLPEVRRFVSQYERAKRHYDLYTAYSARSYAKTFELGRALSDRCRDFTR